MSLEDKSNELIIEDAVSLITTRSLGPKSAFHNSFSILKEVMIFIVKDLESLNDPIRTITVIGYFKDFAKRFHDEIDQITGRLK